MNNIILKEEDSKWMDDNSVTAIETLPSDAWPVLVAACEELTGGLDPGVDCEVAVTHETIADFEASSKKYRELKSLKHFEIAGKPAMEMTGVQLQKGDCRINLIVIDCGTRRAVLSQ